MADTQLAPTDAELDALIDQHRWDATTGRRAIARAVLARWGQPARAAEPVAWAFKYDDGTWHDPSTTEHSSGMRPLFAAPQPAHSGEPVAWKHDCAALLTNDVELWIDACPHCGKPRNAPQPVEREPLTVSQIRDWWASENGLEDCEMCKLTDFLRVVRAVEEKHGIKGGQHGTE